MINHKEMRTMSDHTLRKIITADRTINNSPSYVEAMRAQNMLLERRIMEDKLKEVLTNG